MAPLFFSGSINKQLVFRQVGSKTVVSSYPDFSHRKLSPKQIEMNKLMAEATASAKDIIADDQERNAAQIRLNVTRNRLFNALIKEFIKNRRR